MMHRKWIVPGMALIALVAMGGLVQAGTLNLATSSFSQGTGVGQGGEFKAFNYSGPMLDQNFALDAGADFHTFCLEKNENIQGIASFKINTSAVNGGVGPAGDPLDTETAWLAFTWWKGNLNYNYADVGGTRAVDAEDMQLAVWFLEDEITQFQLTKWDNGKAQDFVDFASSAASNPWLDTATYGTGYIGTVRVMNTFDAAGNKRQDQIVVVPLPASALLGFGLLGLLGAARAIRRRRTL